LSPDGEQPFHSPDGQIHAIVNGELYQDDEARQKLSEDAGWTFKGKSDCEIVIALYQIYGVSFLRHLRGEFALCLYDSWSKMFICARDRYGIKPLFFSEVNGSLIIGAEIKALGPLGLKPEWDVQSIADKGYAHDQRTVFKGVHKVSLPAHNHQTPILMPHRSGRDATSPAIRPAMSITGVTGIWTILTNMLSTCVLSMISFWKFGSAYWKPSGYDYGLMCGLASSSAAESTLRPLLGW
jgi:hypothetical protein